MMAIDTPPVICQTDIHINVVDCATTIFRVASLTARRPFSVSGVSLSAGPAAST